MTKNKRMTKGLIQLNASELKKFTKCIALMICSKIRDSLLTIAPCKELPK